MTTLLLSLIKLYQSLISPLSPPSCRFYPTCSTYMYHSIINHGPWRGSWYGLRRLLKCHPFHPGGCDPVLPSHPKG